MLTRDEDAVDEQGSAIGRQARRPATVFISYRRADERWARLLHGQLKEQGVEAWFDAYVGAGEDWRAATAKALEECHIFVLLFSASAAASDEIAKELAAATLEKKFVVPVRLENIAPKGPFLYELASRNWVNAFENTEGKLAELARGLATLEKSGVVDESIIPFDRNAGMAVTAAAAPASRRTVFSPKLGLAIAAAGLLSLLAAAGAWFAQRPLDDAGHTMTVRLAGFQLLSADLPANFRETVDAEITAAFNVDGVVGVSSAPTPAPGAGPAYAIGGTIQRDGQIIRVITHLINERSGATLWSDTFNYTGDQVSKVPRHIAVDAGNFVRCGLFGASTYSRPLPDAVLRDYMQFCQGHWAPNQLEGRKALVPAHRVVAALPDFSWGWAAVAAAYWKVAGSADSSRIAEEARASGRQAADRAVAIDSRNSEALYIKAMLLDRRDWIGRDDLLKRAVAAQRLDCGCEHHQYGELLVNVGRIAEAVEHLYQANDMLALYVYTPLSLAQALVVAGKPDEAKPFFDAAIGLAPDAGFAKDIERFRAIRIGEANLFVDPTLQISPERREALLQGYRALASRDSGAKAQAIEALLALTEDQQSDDVATLLASLGANREAFQIAARIATARDYPRPSLFWDSRMRGVLDDPGFPAVAEGLGLLNYWKTTRTRPDVCNENAAPPFCRMI